MPRICLVHSTGCRTGFTHAGKILLQLLQCPSGQMAVPLVGWAMPIYLFFYFRCLSRQSPCVKVWHVESSLEIPAKASLSGLWNKGKRFTFIRLLFYSVFHRYLDMRYLVNGWLGWHSLGISFSAVIMFSGWRQYTLFRYTRYEIRCFCCKSLDLAMDELSQGR